MKKIERCARFFYKVIFGNTLYLQQIIRQIARFVKMRYLDEEQEKALL